MTRNDNAKYTFLTVVFRSNALVLPNVDIFPMDYYQNGSVTKVNGSVFCVNTSSTSLVTNPVFSKSSHVSTRHRFPSDYLFLFLFDKYLTMFNS